jgi:hypothetical protein
MTLHQPRLLLIELNEFSVDLFKRGLTELQLPSIQRLMALKSSETVTEDSVEHRGLDPWVQWVSIHTGVPSSQHGIVHLGDASTDLNLRQLWETLSLNGVSSGVWGAMNATRGTAKLCHFFLPDPWTFKEDAFPAQLKDLLALPRYYAKNYLDVSKTEFLAGVLRLIRYVSCSGAFIECIKMIPLILKGLIRNGINNAMLFSLFDLFSTALFLEQRKRSNTQLSIIFLNSIAHLQHHRWEAGDKLSDDLKFGLQAIDHALGLLFASRTEGEALVVMNALTQRNIVHEKPRICYRQVNPARFLNAVGFKFLSVEQLMTNDAHVFFVSTADRGVASIVLSQTTVEGQALFDVKPSLQDPCKLFYQVDFWDELDVNTTVLVNGINIRFFDHFEAIVARTGAHIPEGNAFFDGIALPPKFHNHEVTSFLIRHLLSTKSN